MGKSVVKKSQTKGGNPNTGRVGKGTAKIKGAVGKGRLNNKGR